MFANRFAVFAAALLATSTLAACDDATDIEDIIAPGTRAVVRFVNATDVNVDVLRDGTPEDINLAFGNASRCFPVNVVDPRLGFLVNGTSDLIPGFTATDLVPGAAYLLIAWTDRLGATRFTTIRTDDIVPDLGLAALAFLNAIDRVDHWDAYVTTPGAALGVASVANLAAGLPSRFINVNPGALQVRFTAAGTQTVVHDVGNFDFIVRTTYVGVLAPELPGSSLLRAFIIAGC